MSEPPLPEGFVWLEDFPSPEDVHRLVIVPFDNGFCAIVKRGDDLFFPEWRRGDEGETYFEGAYFAPLKQVGFRYQQLHPFAARSEAEGLLVVGWEHGELREFTDAGRLAESTDSIAARLRKLGKEELATLCDAASHSFSHQTDDTYFQDNKAVLERAYLRATTPQGGSGSSGDDANWEATRRIHVEAIRSDGKYLDTGCANGLLMESMVRWAAEEGYKLNPYGVDISESLVEVARTRLPQWADHIFVGNVMYWDPPIRFDYVTTRLDYVPENRRLDLVRRLLDEVVAPKGRLIVTSAGCSSSAELSTMSVPQLLTRFGFKIVGEATAPRQHIAWIDNPHRD